MVSNPPLTSPKCSIFYSVLSLSTDPSCSHSLNPPLSPPPVHPVSAAPPSPRLRHSSVQNPPLLFLSKPPPFTDEDREINLFIVWEYKVQVPPKSNRWLFFLVSIIKTQNKYIYNLKHSLALAPCWNMTKIAKLTTL